MLNGDRNNLASSRQWLYTSVGWICLLAGFSLTPVVISVIDCMHASQTSLLAPWTFPLITTCVTQFAYSLLLLQVPTRSTLWVMVVFATVLACVYAAICGAAWTASRSLTPHALDQTIVAFGLWEATISGKATLWTGAMAGAYGLTAYLYLHIADLLRRSGASV